MIPQCTLCNQRLYYPRNSVVISELLRLTSRPLAMSSLPLHFLKAHTSRHSQRSLLKLGPPFSLLHFIGGPHTTADGQVRSLVDREWRLHCPMRLSRWRDTPLGVCYTCIVVFVVTYCGHLTTICYLSNLVVLTLTSSSRWRYSQNESCEWVNFKAWSVQYVTKSPPTSRVWHEWTKSPTSRQFRNWHFRFDDRIRPEYLHNSNDS